jgi:CBS domain-containing protein
MDETIIPKLSSMSDAQDIWKFFNRQQFNFPDYICAGDIMNTKPISLKENATLEQAIDFFVKKDLNEIPVVDPDGDLVGVVTAQELLRVCLPDYILWMDDLSPILNFEPFSHILQNESSTWLAEIMSYEYAVVNEKDPAITVAQEITKHRSNQAFVLRDKKLVGVITLQQFLNKILRE